MLSVNMSIYAASYDQVNNDTEYEYEEKSYQWKCTASHDEMVAAYLIPDDEIEKMSTEMLLSAYLNYPLLIDMFVYNTTEMGFNALRKECNALNELLERENAGKAILSKYQKIEPYNLSSVDSASGNDFFKLNALEILAAQPEIIDNMDNNTFVALNNCIYKKCNEKPNDVYCATKYTYYDTLREISDAQPENDNFEKANELWKANSSRAVSAGCYIKSKWGSSGEYNHFYNYGPYGSSNITYWAKA